MAGLERRVTAVRHNGATVHTDSCATSACTRRMLLKSFGTQTSLQWPLSPVCPVSPTWLDALDKGLFFMLRPNKHHKASRASTSALSMQADGPDWSGTPVARQNPLVQMCPSHRGLRAGQKWLGTSAPLYSSQPNWRKECRGGEGRLRHSAFHFKQIHQTCPPPPKPLVSAGLPAFLSRRDGNPGRSKLTASVSR